MQRSATIGTVAIGGTCALLGAAAGIAGSSASSTPTPPPGIVHRALFADPALMLKSGPLGDAAGPPVHSDAVVPNEKGGFDAVTMDRGSFSSLSGSDLTITEGTKSATYKTVTFSIPSGATIRRNGAQARLSDLKRGDTVVVLQGPKGTIVGANDAQHEPPMPPKGGFFRGRPGQLPAPPELPLTPEEGSTRSGEAGPGGPATSTG